VIEVRVDKCGEANGNLEGIGKDIPCLSGFLIFLLGYFLSQGRRRLSA
jgi:hypothetical protein